MSFCGTTTSFNEEAKCSLGFDDCHAFRFAYKRRRSSEENFSDVLALTAKELNSLSVQDREKMFEEVHGISSTIDEDPCFVENCLSRLDQELERANFDSSAYELALSMRPKLKYDRKFRLMFLRADCFDARKAARNIILHFEKKRIFFGESKLAKKITLDDLSEEDRIQCRSGYMQFLPSKDQAGRTLVFMNVKRATNQSWISKFRGIWYKAMDILETDEEVQKKGFVTISYYVGCQSVSSGSVETIDNFRAHIGAIPLRIVGLHLCYDNPLFRPLVFLTQHAIGTKHRIRFRAHYGSDIECQYKLMAFGIPQSILPIDSSGEYRGDQAKKSNEKQVQCRHMDSDDSTMDLNTNSLNKSTTMDGVGNRDVLLGRGVNQFHPANARLSDIILSKRNEYDAASKFEKTCIAMSIAETMKESNGRFMKRRKKGCDEWIEVDDAEARKSIVGRFRNLIPK